MKYFEKRIKDSLQDIFGILMEEINEERVGSHEYIAARDFINFSLKYLERIHEKDEQ